MAEAAEDALIGQDMAGGDEVLDQNATDAEIAQLRAAVAEPTSWLTSGKTGPEGAPEGRQRGRQRGRRGGGSRGAIEWHDQDFHVTFARLSRNPMLIDLLCAELYPMLRLYRGTPVTHRPPGHRALIEHERIVSAIEDRDPDLAELMMRRHITAARRRRETALVQVAGE